MNYTSLIYLAIVLVVAGPLVVFGAWLEGKARRARRSETEHRMKNDPRGYYCSCGGAFDDYGDLADHVRWHVRCPLCGVASVGVGDHELHRWACGHWIARDDLSSRIRGGRQ